MQLAIKVYISENDIYTGNKCAKWSIYFFPQNSPFISCIRCLDIVCVMHVKRYLISFTIMFHLFVY